MSNGIVKQSDSASWPRYTLTGLIGLMSGLVSVYVSMTVSNQSRIAALETEQIIMRQSLQRVETKMDALTQAVLEVARRRQD